VGGNALVLRVVFIVGDPESGAASLRVLAHMDAFEREGVDVYPMVLPRTLRSRRKMFADAATFDVVVLENLLLTPWELADVRKKVRLLGYDAAEAPEGAACSSPVASLFRGAMFGRTVRCVDFVTAADASIAKLCARGDGRVFVIATAVDASRGAPGSGPEKLKAPADDGEEEGSPDAASRRKFESEHSGGIIVGKWAALLKEVTHKS